MTKKDIQQLLAADPAHRSKLFARGYYFTDAPVDDAAYPFYGLWARQTAGRFTLLTAEGQRAFACEGERYTLVLAGHAYDPVSMVSDEQAILASLARHPFPSDAFWAEFNGLTGIFTLFILDGERLHLVGDPTCMQTAFYGVKDGHVYISSHTNCIGDLLDLDWDPYVRELVHYRFYRLLGNCLPGDLTPFPEIKRLVPNFYVTFGPDLAVTCTRFYWPQLLEVTEQEIVDRAAAILHANMALIPEKWERPAISLTGGCDSKTTLACANGLYDRYRCFSYSSSDAEELDARAARTISEKLGIPHKIYEISQRDEDYPDIETVRTLLFWNTGGTRTSNPNDVRKRAAFADTPDFDVEVKSWSSEIGRAYYSKRFNGRRSFGDKPTPRACTTIYKYFFHNRKLVKHTDRAFADYLDKYYQPHPTRPVEWQEQFFWEFRVAYWKGLNITGEHRYSFDITIPYNNRDLLALLLSASFDARFRDTVYAQIREKMNPAIDALGITVQNLKHDKKRERGDDLYYVLHSRFPF